MHTWKYRNRSKAWNRGRRLGPQEILRIQQASGFANYFGRVNGNLNVSQSIGDLKYK